MRTLTLIAFICLLGRAQGSPIIFNFAGTGSGSLGGSSFSNSQFTITANADTTDFSVVNPDVQQILVQSATVQVTGFSLGQFQIGLRLFHSPFVSVPPGSIGDQTVGLSLASGPDLLNLFNPAFVNYNLVSSLGPVFVSTPDPQSRLSFNNIPTSIGAMTLSASRNVTFTAALVPEPSSAVLLATGALGLLLRNRKSKSDASRRFNVQNHCGDC